MGVLDDLTKLSGGSGATGGNLTGNAALLQSVLGTVGSSSSGGGLGGLIQAFSQAGLGDIMSSWVGTGQNDALTVDVPEAGTDETHE